MIKIYGRHFLDHDVVLHYDEWMFWLFGLDFEFADTLIFRRAFHVDDLHHDESAGLTACSSPVGMQTPPCSVHIM